MPWERNPELLRQGKAHELDTRYGHRVIALSAIACPTPYQECKSHMGSEVKACPGCGFMANAARLFPPLESAFHSHVLTKDSPNPAYPERLEHRWLSDIPTITCDGKTYEYHTHFVLDGRNVVWLGDDVPAKEREYTVSYHAFKEEHVQLIHVAGGRSLGARPEEGQLTANAFVENGSIMLSIPPEASCYHVQMGDIFVIADGSERFSQTIDVSLENRKAWSQWVIRVVQAVYRKKTAAGFELVDITAQTSFDFPSKTWSFGELPPLVRNVSVTFDYAPMYQVFTDKGETRTPHFATQPRMVKAARMEVTF